MHEQFQKFFVQQQKEPNKTVEKFFSSEQTKFIFTVAKMHPTT